MKPSGSAVFAFVAVVSMGCAHHRQGLVPVPAPSRPLGELLAGLRDGDAAVRASSAWALQFEPATRGGRPAPIVAEAPVTFRIDQRRRSFRNG